MSRTPLADSMDTMNACAVGGSGDSVAILRPHGLMSRVAALNLVAWLVVLADLSADEIEAARAKIEST